MKPAIKGELVSEDSLTSLWGWLPVAITDGDSLPSIWWRLVGDHRFTEPFFSETLNSIPLDSRYSCRTSPESLAQFSKLECVEPSAFVFHASRCGSTLLTQLLATVSRCIVISEASVVDSALNLCRFHVTRNRGIEILKGVVRAFGQRRFGDERHLIFKLDSWHITHLPLIRAAFPDTPCFFVYRSPSEILSSHRRQRGRQMVPGLLDSELLGIGSEYTDPASLDGYCLRVLSSFFRSATLHAQSDDVLLINYTQLPTLIWTEFAQFLSLSLNATEVRLMQDRSVRHSKHPWDQFLDETPQDIDEAYADAIRNIENYYNELERHRQNHDPWPLKL